MMCHLATRYPLSAATCKKAGTCLTRASKYECLFTFIPFAGLMQVTNGATAKALVWCEASSPSVEQRGTHLGSFHLRRRPDTTRTRQGQRSTAHGRAARTWRCRPQGAAAARRFLT